MVAATNRAEINHAVAEEARRLGLWVNVVDDPAYCDFIVPAVLRRGDLVIAFSTGGKSPALARRLRDEFDRAIGPEYEILIDLLDMLRTEVKQHGAKVPPERWQDAVALVRERLTLGQSKDQILARARTLLLTGQR